MATKRENRVEVYQDATGWHWRIVAANGRELATSPVGDGYNRRQRALAIAEKLAAPLALVVKD